MKKTLIFLSLIALVAVCFSSCKKSCVCSYTLQSTGQTITETIEGLSKDDCTDKIYEISYAISSGGCTWSNMSY